MVRPASGSCALYTVLDGDFASSLTISNRPIRVDMSRCLEAKTSGATSIINEVGAQELLGKRHYKNSEEYSPCRVTEVLDPKFHKLLMLGKLLEVANLRFSVVATRFESLAYRRKIATKTREKRTTNA